MSDLNLGFDPKRIMEQIDAIGASFNKIAKALTEDFTNDLVNQVANYWACDEAKEYFNNLKTDINKLIYGDDNSINYNYQQAYDVINTCASNWDKSLSFSKGGFGRWSDVYKPTHEQLQLEVSGIKEEIGGVSGINSEKVLSVAESAFETCLGTLKAAINSAQSAIDNTGFIDEESAQMNKLKDSLTALQSHVENQINAEKTQIIEDVNACVKNYGDTKNTNVGNFSSGE